MAPNQMIPIEVAYAGKHAQVVLACQVPVGTTARQAFIHAGLEAQCEELRDTALNDVPLGIFSRPLRAPDDYQVQVGDRIEGYRPLECDPKQARRQRAAHKRPTR